jgi:hypothetical protein
MPVLCDVPWESDWTLVAYTELLRLRKSLYKSLLAFCSVKVLLLRHSTTM